MPKATPPTTPSRRAGKASSESPRKQPRKSPRKTKAEAKPVDESQWRPSTIRPTERINRTAALQLYRLKKEDLEGLNCTEEEKEIVVSGELKKVPTFWYWERDVERVAWKAHGGPDGFEAYLEKLRQTHNKRYPGKEFKVPSAYDPAFRAGAATVRIVSLPPVTGDIYANTPTLVDLKKRMKVKAHGDEWLWNVCNEHLSLDWDRFPNNTDHAKAIHAVLRDLPNYPSRILPPSDPSPSFQALSNVLVEAPTRLNLEKNEKNIRVDHVAFPDEIHYHWSQDYFTKVYTALMDIIREHGVGPQGWEAARWIVYDKYSQWDGIKIQAEGSPFAGRSFTACDNAYGWLQGRLPPGQKPQLEFSIFDVHNHPPPIWTEYNALLPDSD